jgi:hypothetical protein
MATDEKKAKFFAHMTETAARKAKPVDEKFLREANKRVSAKYGKSKWLQFVERMQTLGVACRVYIAKSSVSKYVFVDYNGLTVKLRFSEHAPTRDQIARKDSDIYVGVSALGVINMEDAFKATVKRLGVK